MHGEEKVSAFSLYWFMKNVAENWSSDPFLEYLHWNVSFEIIPYCNPSGYMFGVSGTRKNNNGVDINRNFDSKWGVVTDPSQPEYCGPSPFSEVEAQYIRDMILANLDAALFFDFHMSGESGSGWTNVCWMAMPNLKTEYFPNIVRAFKTVLSKCSRAWRTNRSFDPSQTYYGYVSIADYGGTATRYAHSQGIPGCLFECAKMLPTHGGVIGKSEIITVSKEIAGNAILNMLKVAKESPLKQKGRVSVVRQDGVCMEHSGVCAEIHAVKDDIADNIKPDISEIKKEIKGLTKHVYYAAGAIAFAFFLIEKVWK